MKRFYNALSYVTTAALLLPCAAIVLNLFS